MTQPQPAHTPGPWNIATEKNKWIVIGCGEWSDKTNKPRAICFIPNGGKEDVEPERYAKRLANARLIAASPELLEALEQISRAAKPFSPLDLTQTQDTVRMIAQAAIAKAEKGDSR